MCLHIKGIKKIAEKNLVVNKKLRDCWACIYTYKYSINEKNPTVEIVKKWGEVAEGYHSWNSFFKGNSIFIIPKGSSYYEGKQFDGCLGKVSSDIVYIGSKFSLLTYWRLYKWITKK